MFSFLSKVPEKCSISEIIICASDGPFQGLHSPREHMVSIFNCSNDISIYICRLYICCPENMEKFRFSAKVLTKLSISEIIFGASDRPFQGLHSTREHMVSIFNCSKDVSISICILYIFSPENMNNFQFFVKSAQKSFEFENYFLSIG